MAYRWRSSWWRAGKPFNPGQVGLLRTPEPEHGYSFVLGTIDKAPQSQELLGWTIIPVSLTGALVLGWLTWRFGVFAVRLMAATRRRRPAVLQPA